MTCNEMRITQNQSRIEEIQDENKVAAGVFRGKSTAESWMEAKRKSPTVYAAKFNLIPTEKTLTPERIEQLLMKHRNFLFGENQSLPTLFVYALYYAGAEAICTGNHALNTPCHFLVLRHLVADAIAVCQRSSSLDHCSASFASRAGLALVAILRSRRWSPVW
jgi:hypothetical protein